MNSSSVIPRTRLFVAPALAENISLTCDEKRAHYLMHVLRLRAGTQVVVFNGKDGEWLATLESAQKKSATLNVERQLRMQVNSPDLWLLCTPLKQSRTDGVVEKATELGVSRIAPVGTRFTSIDRVNVERLHAISIEAAEQCERMDVPEVDAIMPLEKKLGDWPQDRLLIYADESGAGLHPQALAQHLAAKKSAILIGPEGGFASTELDMLRRLPYAKAITLGPRILRADTAAIATLTLIQAIAGDWEKKPAFRNQENH